MIQPIQPLGCLIVGVLVWWQFRGAARVLDWMAAQKWIKPYDESGLGAVITGGPSHRDFLVMVAVFTWPYGPLLAVCLLR